MKCKDIIKNWLRENGYDGLCHPEYECGCGLDDFMPCCEDLGECEPAYKDGDGYYLEKPNKDLK